VCAISEDADALFALIKGDVVFMFSLGLAQTVRCQYGVAR
jgi:hypothetical protein